MSNSTAAGAPPFGRVPLTATPLCRPAGSRCRPAGSRCRPGGSLCRPPSSRSAAPAEAAPPTGATAATGTGGTATAPGGGASAGGGTAPPRDSQQRFCRVALRSAGREVLGLGVVHDDGVRRLLRVQLELLRERDADPLRLQQPHDLRPVLQVGAGGVPERVARSAVALVQDLLTDVGVVVAGDAELL